MKSELDLIYYAIKENLLAADELTIPHSPIGMEHERSLS